MALNSLRILKISLFADTPRAYQSEIRVCSLDPVVIELPPRGELLATILAAYAGVCNQNSNLYHFDCCFFIINIVIFMNNTLILKHYVFEPKLRLAFPVCNNYTVSF